MRRDEDHYTNTEADAAQYNEYVWGDDYYYDPDKPTALEAEADMEIDQ